MIGRKVSIERNGKKRATYTIIAILEDGYLAIRDKDTRPKHVYFIKLKQDDIFD